MTRPPDSDSASSSAVGMGSSSIPRVIAVVIAVLGFLPIANWIAGGHDVPWYAAVAGEWVNGTMIVIGAGVVLAIMSRRFPALWRDGATDRAVGWAQANPVAFGGFVAALALALYAVVAVAILSARPLFIDELVQLLQAQIFAEGRLWRAAQPYPEFHSALNVLD